MPYKYTFRFERRIQVHSDYQSFRLIVLFIVYAKDKDEAVGENCADVNICRGTKLFKVQLETNSKLSVTNSSLASSLTLACSTNATLDLKTSLIEKID